MESKSKEESAGRWVKASERLPEKDISKMYYGKTTRGRADIFQWDSMVQFFRPMIHEADEMFEWLDESKTQQSGFAREHRVYGWASTPQPQPTPVSDGWSDEDMGNAFFAGGAFDNEEEFQTWLSNYKNHEHR